MVFMFYPPFLDVSSEELGLHDLTCYYQHEVSLIPATDHGPGQSPSSKEGEHKENVLLKMGQKHLIGLPLRQLTDTCQAHLQKATSVSDTEALLQKDSSRGYYDLKAAGI